MKRTTFMDFLYSKTMSFIIFFIILLSFCYLGKVPMIRLGIKAFVTIIIPLLITIYLLTRDFSSFVIFFLIYWIALIIASYLGQYSSVNLAFETYYKIFALVAYLDYGLRKHTKNTIYSLYCSLYILVTINVLTIIIYPEGMYFSNLYKNNWFFDYDNTHIFMYFPAILVMICNLEINNRKMFIMEWILMAMITFGVFYCFSANSVVSYIIFLVYIIFKKVTFKVKMFNAKNYLIAYFVIFIGIVILRLQNIFAWLIVDVLEKSLTISTRTFVWDKVIMLIKESWIFGYGMESTNIIIEKFGSIYFTHAHNTILDVFYKGGLLSFIPHILLLILSVKELYKNRNHRLSKKMSIVILCLFIMMNFEAREDKIGLYIALILGYNINNIIRLLDIKEISKKDNDKNESLPYDKKEKNFLELGGI